MQFNKSQIDIAYHNIFNGYSPFLWENKLYYAKHISSKELFKINAHALLVEAELREAKIPCEYDIIQEAIANELWTHAQDVEIQTLEKKIKLKEEILPKLPLPSQVTQVKNEIKYIVNQIKEKQQEKQKLTGLSLENKVSAEKRDYIGFLCIYKDVGVPCWADYQTFLDSNTLLVNNLINKYFNIVNELGSSLVRAVAKNTDARYRMKFFTCTEVHNMSILFLELKQWCDFYTSISELPDRPSDSIIEDDDKLDAWLLSRKTKNQQEKSVNNGGDGGFTGIIGATKQDMEILEGTDRETVIAAAKAQNG